MKRQMELFLIILLPILGLVFLGGKIMPLTKRPEQEDNDLISKESRTKTRRRHKKRTTGLPKRTRTEGY